MLKIISSKIITAIKGSPLINEELFRQIQERLTGQHPLSSEQKFDDSGKPRGVFLDTMGPGMGSNDRKVNPGVGMGLGRDENESKDPRSPSSGYNDGKRVDDETGPGNKSIIGPEGENPNPYEPVDMNPVFMDHRMMGQIGGDRDSIQSHLKTTLKGPSVRMPRKRKVN